MVKRDSSSPQTQGQKGREDRSNTAYGTGAGNTQRTYPDREDLVPLAQSTFPRALQQETDTDTSSVSDTLQEE